MKTITPFSVIGIKVRTTNENGQSVQDIPKLWERFWQEDIASQIPNRIDEHVLSIYTNYESDHTKPYDTLIGCRVNSLDTIPEGMVGQYFEGGSYKKFIAKGDLNKGIVYEKWLNIWEADLARVFTADFEVYGENAQDPQDAEVAIFIAI